MKTLRCPFCSLEAPGEVLTAHLRRRHPELALNGEAKTASSAPRPLLRAVAGATIGEPVPVSYKDVNTKLKPALSRKARKKAKALAKKQKVAARIESHLLKVEADQICKKQSVSYILPENTIGRLTPTKAAATRWRGSVRARTSLSCPLCGGKIRWGKMLEHKEIVHGEIATPLKISPPNRRRRVWIKVVQGGLPGLGKKR